MPNGKDWSPETPPELQPVLDQLSAREPIFHRPEFGTTRADFETMTAPEFWEIGASGRVYDRPSVLDVLELRHSIGGNEEHWDAWGFACRAIGPDLYLLTYTLRQGRERLTRRSTIWRKDADAWRALFHQGTIIQIPSIAVH